ncbi:streptomycin 6-kinase [Thermosporothrix hazakensis]|jgi:streptomycin 6-kinase|uniref:Streptomycin 6-kinase n=1 Tax=Thermosporothrix hazakensis TaxID=644383 RepID=A0A326U8A9_THEHA|nr:aminoglycoside phosphotransferase family protein [Thermosporothrix hazakensis]PZW31941.1 streptomycin 6-kinase [Thermosporothrix hazakensis]GCE49734.1 hydroxyurea phosphotransferase [Thermosporothrix hazakensis]
MIMLPEEFHHHILKYHEEEGAAWLERLPTILETCIQRWNLSLEPPFGNLSFHYVVPATQSDGTPVVLKACAPTGEFQEEVAALQHFAGKGMARLLAFDSDTETMLLERLLPGTILSTIQDDQAATSAAAAVMRKLWKPVSSDYPFPTILEWGQGLTRLRAHYNGGHGPFPAALLEEAEANLTELGASMPEQVLLHGDLHHDNILSAHRDTWLAIDPKGVVGEPAFEIGAFLHNPGTLFERPHPERIIARRVDQFVDELGLDRKRVLGWSIVQSVLAAWWGVEDADQLWEEALRCAEILSTLKR